MKPFELHPQPMPIRNNSAFLYTSTPLRHVCLLPLGQRDWIPGTYWLEFSNPPTSAALTSAAVDPLADVNPSPDLQAS